MLLGSCPTVPITSTHPAPMGSNMSKFSRTANHQSVRLRSALQMGWRPTTHYMTFCGWLAGDIHDSCRVKISGRPHPQLLQLPASLHPRRCLRRSRKMLLEKGKLVQYRRPNILRLFFQGNDHLLLQVLPQGLPTEAHSTAKSHHSTFRKRLHSSFARVASLSSWGLPLPICASVASRPHLAPAPADSSWTLGLSRLLPSAPA